MTRCGVDRVELAAVDRGEVPCRKIHLRAQPHALPADWPYGDQVVPADVSHRLVTRSQLLRKPHQLDRTVGRFYQMPTRPEMIEIAIVGALQQSRWVVDRPPCRSGSGWLTAEGLSSEVVDKGFDETDWTICGNVVVLQLWERIAAGRFTPSRWPMPSEAPR